MKKIWFLASCLFIYSCSGSGEPGQREKPTADEHAAKMKEMNVQFMEKTTNPFDRDSYVSEKHEFNEEGYTIKEEYLSMFDSNINKRIVHTYDEDNNRVKTVEYEDENKLYKSFEYIYEDGNMVLAHEYNRRNEYDQSIAYEYDGKGRLITKYNRDSKDGPNTSGERYTYDGGDLVLIESFSSSGSIYWTNKMEGKSTDGFHWIEYNDKMDPQSFHLYRYGPDKLKTYEEDAYSRYQTNDKSTFEFTYDPPGVLKSSNWVADGKLINTYTYNYITRK